MDSPRIEILAREWQESKRYFVKESSFQIYLITLEKHILPEFGDRTAVGEEDVQQFVLKKLREGLKLSSVRTMVMILKMIVQPEKPWRINYPSDLKNDKVQTFSKGDFIKLKKYVTEHPGYKNLGIDICMSTGIRIGEICALQWKDIDLKYRTLSIRKTLERIYICDADKRHTKMVIGPPKTKDSIREIPLSDELHKTLVPVAKDKNPDDYILSNSASPIEPRTYRNYYDSLVEMLGIKRLKFHSLRHTFATRCIESGADYKTVSEILGHSSIGTTLNLYVHPNMEQKMKCVNMLSKSLSY